MTHPANRATNLAVSPIVCGADARSGIDSESRATRSIPCLTALAVFTDSDRDSYQRAFTSTHKIQTQIVLLHILVRTRGTKDTSCSAVCVFLLRVASLVYYIAYTTYVIFLKVALITVFGDSKLIILRVHTYTRSV
jgi:hypothetical protein